MNGPRLLVVSVLVAGPVGRAGAGAARRLAEGAEPVRRRAARAPGQGNYDEAADKFQEAYAARPLPDLLYNVGAAYHLKGKKQNDVDAYSFAVKYYRDYLVAVPKATDKADGREGDRRSSRRRSSRLKAPPAGPDAPPVAPSEEVQKLDDKIRSPGRHRDRAPGRQHLPRRQEERRLRPDAVVRLPRRRAQGHHREARPQVEGEPDRARPQPPGRAAGRDVRGGLPRLGRDPRRTCPAPPSTSTTRRSAPSARRRSRATSSRASTRCGSSADGYDETEHEVEIIAGETHEIDGGAVGHAGRLPRHPRLRPRRRQRSTSTASWCASAARAASRSRRAPTPSRSRRSGYKTVPRRGRSAGQDRAVDRGPTCARSRAAATRWSPTSSPRCSPAAATYAYIYQGDLVMGDKQFDRKDQIKIGAYVGWGLGGVIGLSAVYYTFRDKGPPSTGRSTCAPSPSNRWSARTTPACRSAAASSVRGAARGRGPTRARACRTWPTRRTTAPTARARRRWTAVAETAAGSAAG